MQIKPIQTERLLLRGFTADDALFAIGIWNDPEMGAYLPDPVLETIDPEYLHMVETLGEDAECCYLIIEKRETGERVGTCSFIPSPDGKTYDIAYCVHKAFQKNGYATEAAAGMIAYARRQGAEKVTVSVGAQNEASKAVVRKLGFTPIGEATYRKRGTEKIMADICYSLTL